MNLDDPSIPAAFVGPNGTGTSTLLDTGGGVAAAFRGLGGHFLAQTAPWGGAATAGVCAAANWVSPAPAGGRNPEFCAQRLSGSCLGRGRDRRHETGRFVAAAVR